MNITGKAIKIKTFLTKGWGRDIIAFTALVMAVLASFYIGKSSKIAISATPVLIETTAVKPVLVQQKSNMSNSGGGEGSIVAAKNGTRFYPPGCTGANRIKPENRVFFKTEGEAEAAGYTRAQTCK